MFDIVVILCNIWYTELRECNKETERSVIDARIYVRALSIKYLCLQCSAREYILQNIGNASVFLFLYILSKLMGYIHIHIFMGAHDDPT